MTTATVLPDHDPGPAMLCLRCDRASTDGQFRLGLCHRCYERDRRKRKTYAKVDATPARRYIAVLVTAGWKYREISRAADLSHVNLMRIVHGQRSQILIETRAAILGINLATRENYIRKAWDARREEKGHSAGPRSKGERKARKIGLRRREQARIEQERRERVEMARLIQEERREEKNASLADTVQQARRDKQLSITSAQRIGGHGLDHDLDGLLAVFGVHPEVEDTWRDEAVCAQVDPEIFFPEKGGSTRAAKLVCARCPVQEQCLDTAFAWGERFGIWGGLSERERRGMDKDHRPDRGHKLEVMI